MLKAILFDMDGVIIDSEPLHAKAAVNAMKKFGITITTDFCYSFIGRPQSICSRSSRKNGICQAPLKS